MPPLETTVTVKVSTPANVLAKLVISDKFVTTVPMLEMTPLAFRLAILVTFVDVPRLAIAVTFADVASKFISVITSLVIVLRSLTKSAVTNAMSDTN